MFADGAMDGERWMAVVADAVRRITAGALEKVVLARDLVATAATDIDVRWPLTRLARELPDVLDVPRGRPLRRHPRDAGDAASAAW